MRRVPLDETASILLRDRSRYFLWMLLALCVVPILTDLPLEHPARNMLLSLGLARLAVPAICLLLVRRSVSPEPAVWAIWFVILFLIAQGPFGTVWRSADNAIISLVVATGTCVVAAALLPWGWRFQLGIVAMAVGEVTWEFFYWRSTLPQGEAAPFVLALVCVLISMPVAVITERDERMKVEARARLRQARSAAERLASELTRRVEHRGRVLAASTERLTSTCATLNSSLGASLAEVKRLAEVAGRGALTGEASALLSRIDAAVGRMAATLDAVIGYVELARAPLDHEMVDLTEAAASAVSRLRERDPLRSVEVKIEPGMRAWGDPVLVGEAVEHLIDNAWKFSSGSKEARIEVGMRSADDGGQLFVVRDSGAGFDARFADKLFHPFERLEGMERFPGLGIGLARVRRIVSRHGGRVLAVAEPGSGAEFGFVLPPVDPGAPS